MRAGLPLAVLAVALVIGSGVLSGKPQTSAQRAAAIESVVRCPSCIDVSVAQSDQSTALAVRHEIERQVAQGRTTAQIEQSLVSQYGQTILLEPPDSGGFAVIWILPIAAGGGRPRRDRRPLLAAIAPVRRLPRGLTAEAAQPTADTGPFTGDAA